MGRSRDSCSTPTSSSSSSGEDDRRRRKSSKKHKRKSEKKHKRRHKRKAHSPPPTAASIPITAPVGESEVFSVALPPHLLNPPKQEPKPLIGPVLPTEFQPSVTPDIEHAPVDTEFDLADTYGPLPATSGTMNAAQLELEERALKLKMASIDGTGAQSEDQTVREEWMLELPAVGLKGGLAALSNMKRTFHQGKERPDFTDRSSWTKTPQGEGQTPASSKVSAEALKRRAQADYERQRDAEQEQMAKKHKKKHKRDESLVDLHQKKLRKEQKQKEKERAAAGEKPERRPFSRDVDLKLNKIDKHQTKQIVDKAKILDTKFSTGHRKYL